MLDTLGWLHTQVIDNVNAYAVISLVYSGHEQ